MLIGGGGNSKTQVLAKVSKIAATTWVTVTVHLLLPDDVDGLALFDRATARLRGCTADRPVGGIGDIVMVPSVVDPCARGMLN